MCYSALTLVNDYTSETCIRPTYTLGLWKKDREGADFRKTTRTIVIVMNVLWVINNDSNENSGITTGMIYGGCCDKAFCDVLSKHSCFSMRLVLLT